MWTLKTILFPLFGKHAKISDTHKDGNDKGIWERFNEALAQDFDDELLPLIESLVENTVDPENFLLQFVEHYETSIGTPVYISNTEAIRRKLIKLNNSITRIRGTKKSFDVLYNILGMTTVTIAIETPLKTWDSNVTLDDEARRFDRNPCCAFYSLTLAGPASINDSLQDAINRINNYLKPIGATTTEILYNGSPIILSS